MLELRGLKEDSRYEGSRQRGNSMDQGVMLREAQFGGEGGRKPAWSGFKEECEERNWRC